MPGAPSAGGDSRSVRDNLLDVVQLCASEAAFAAIKADGSVVVWGSSDSGGDASGRSEVLLGLTVDGLRV